jgi:pyridinium-3,5-biscarboxylic acid mononucleotide sulfurtransferase
VPHTDVPLDGAAEDDGELLLRLSALESRLCEIGSLMVAFSGGVDSSFLLAAAVRAVGTDRVVAATAVSASLPRSELDHAVTFARAQGVRHLTPPTHEMQRDGYTSNGADRCFHCKAELLDVLTPLAVEHGTAVATGTNADDLVAGFRPGIRAAALRGALTPLSDAGLTKLDIRSASRQWGLVTYDKPAAACLSSRVAYGIAISPERLGRIERAEFHLRAAMLDAGMRVRDLRVRDMGDTARVEVDPELVARLDARRDVLAAVEGFDDIVVDPRGFRSGSMNEALASDD